MIRIDRAFARHRACACCLPVDVPRPADARRARESSIADLVAADPAVRARAACELRELGDAAADAIQPLVGMLGDAAPVESRGLRPSARGAAVQTI